MGDGVKFQPRLIVRQSLGLEWNRGEANDTKVYVINEQISVEFSAWITVDRNSDRNDIFYISCKLTTRTDMK